MLEKKKQEHDKQVQELERLLEEERSLKEQSSQSAQQALQEFEAQLEGERAKHDCSENEIRSLLESENKQRFEVAQTQAAQEKQGLESVIQSISRELEATTEKIKDQEGEFSEELNTLKQQLSDNKQTLD